MGSKPSFLENDLQDKENIAEDSESESDQEEFKMNFENEMKETIERGINENIEVENIQTEVQSLRLTSEKNFVETLDAFMKILLQHLKIASEEVL